MFILLSFTNWSEPTCKVCDNALWIDSIRSFVFVASFSDNVPLSIASCILLYCTEICFKYPSLRERLSTSFSTAATCSSIEFDASFNALSSAPSPSMNENKTGPRITNAVVNAPIGPPNAAIDVPNAPIVSVCGNGLEVLLPVPDIEFHLLLLFLFCAIAFAKRAVVSSFVAFIERI